MTVNTETTTFDPMAKMMLATFVRLLGSDHDADRERFRNATQRLMIAGRPIIDTRERRAGVPPPLLKEAYLPPASAVRELLVECGLSPLDATSWADRYDAEASRWRRWFSPSPEPTLNELARASRAVFGAV